MNNLLGMPSPTPQPKQSLFRSQHPNIPISGNNSDISYTEPENNSIFSAIAQMLGLIQEKKKNQALLAPSAAPSPTPPADRSLLGL